MRRINNIIKQFFASFFSLTSVGMFAYGLITFQFGLIASAVVWFLCGGLIVQSLKDMEKVLDGE